MKIHPFLSAILIAASQVFGQQAAPTPPILPSGPLLNRAPEYSQWLVTDMVPGGSKSATDTGLGGIKARVTLRTVITKTGPIVHQESVDSAGPKQDIWIKGRVATIIFPGWQRPAITPLAQDYSKVDFPGFEWIAASNFIGIEKLFGTDCLVFMDGAGGSPNQTSGAAPASAAPKNGLPADADPNRTTAWIALDSRLPMLLTGHGELHLYQFRPPPPAMQTLPAAFESIMQSSASQTNDLSGRRSDPP